MKGGKRWKREEMKGEEREGRRGKKREERERGISDRSMYKEER